MDCFEGTIPYSNLPTHTNKQYYNQVIQLLLLQIDMEVFVLMIIVITLQLSPHVIHLLLVASYEA
jgi:hypothetical protein